MSSLEVLIKNIPKCELHIHIEGSLEPELMFRLANKNGIQLAYQSIDEVKSAYQFSDLQSFLDIYYQAASVLIDEQDFYDLTWAYLKRCYQDKVQHVEIFFDPQTHTSRGISIATVINGIVRALHDAASQWGLSSFLIPCILRHLSADEAMQTLEQLRPHREHFIALGLDSSELGHPPSKFTQVFAKAREMNCLTVAHAGEEGPPEYVWQALHDLKVSRIDHGVRCQEDERLMKYLKQSQTPLTVCPLSNVKLKIFDSMAEHNLKTMLDYGLCVMINSDDPAYFGGYLNDNYLAVQAAMRLTQADIKQLAINSFKASFLPLERKQAYIDKVNGLSL